MPDPQKDSRAAKPLDPETQQFDTSKMVDPNEDSSKEPTPIGDEVAQKYNGSSDDDAEDGDDNEEETEGIPFTAKAYKVDVERALARTTQDGKGEEEVPESDWQGYATDDVEVQD